MRGVIDGFDILGRECVEFGPQMAALFAMARGTGAEHAQLSGGGRASDACWRADFGRFAVEYGIGVVAGFMAYLHGVVRPATVVSTLPGRLVFVTRLCVALPIRLQLGWAHAPVPGLRRIHDVAVDCRCGGWRADRSHLRGS